MSVLENRKNDSETNKCSSSLVIDLVEREQVSKRGDFQWVKSLEVNERVTMKKSESIGKRKMEEKRKSGELDKRRKKRNEIDDNKANNNVDHNDHSNNWSSDRHIKSVRKEKIKVATPFLNRNRPQTCFSSAVEESLLLESSEVREVVEEMKEENREGKKILTDLERVMPFERFKGYQGVSFCSKATMIILLGLVILTSILLLEYPTSTSGTIVKPQGLNRELEKQIVDKILGEGYDKRIRPSGINNKTGQNDGPAVVRVNTLIRSISKIDDVTMEYSVQLTLRQEWVDERLAFNKMASYKNYNINSITLTEQERLWKPDLFFRNEKEGHFHKIIMPNVLLRINGDGSVLYSIRISLVLACPMDLKYYPLDKQNCTIEMASYGYLEDDLKFIWKEKNPVQINQPLTLPRFTLETFGTAFCTSRTATGTYSCLRVDLIFKREFSYYLIQIYIPCCMLVIVSWVSFWLDPNAIPARVSLGVTTLLTMATQISGINASLPPVSYTKAIDVWTGVCLTFVFGALLEFALVNYASRSDAHARMQQARLEEELKARELEYLQRQHLAAATAVAQQQHQHNNQGYQQQQQQQQKRHQNQHYAAYGPPNYAQKFPVNRSDTKSGLVNNQQNNAQSNNNSQSNNNNNSNNINGQQQSLPNGNLQYAITIGNTGTNQATNEQAVGDKQLLSNGGLVGVNSFQFQNSSANKQCEIHHSLLHANSNNAHLASHHHHQLHHRTGASGAAAAATTTTSNKNNKKGANVNFCRAWLNKFPSRSKRIDVISRIFFPKMFALFNLVYWTTYLFREDDIVQA